MLGNEKNYKEFFLLKFPFQQMSILIYVHSSQYFTLFNNIHFFSSFLSIVISPLVCS